jgi:hypothetical protein
MNPRIGYCLSSCKREIEAKIQEKERKDVNGSYLSLFLFVHSSGMLALNYSLSKGVCWTE